MTALGKVETVSDAELRRKFTGEELTAAMWLRDVVRMRNSKQEAGTT